MKVSDNRLMAVMAFVDGEWDVPQKSRGNMPLSTAVSNTRWKRTRRTK